MNDKKEIDLDKVTEALTLDSKSSSVSAKQCMSMKCDYTGLMDKGPRGNIYLLIALFLCGILPGIVYWLWTRKYDYYCPKCGKKY